MEQNLNETINVSKSEYDYMKQIHDDYIKSYNYDFFVKIRKGLIVPKENPNYNNGRICIEIYDEYTYLIQIEGKNYSIKNVNTFAKIKNVVENYIEKLIYYSKLETKQYLLENAYEGGAPTGITVKYGQLIINLNGQVFGEIGDFCSQFQKEIVDLILNESNNLEQNEEKTIEGDNEISDETQRVLNNYLEEVKEYNRKIQNGEEPDINLGDLLNKYRDIFDDEKLESKIKDIEKESNNFKFDSDDTINELIHSINERLKELDETDNK